MSLTHLFSPIKIGQMELRNRVIMGSMHVGLEGESNGKLALETFYQNRAKEGGPALIVTGGISVSLEGEGGNHFLGFYREKDRIMMQGLTKAVHDVGGRIAAQLFHAGRYAFPELTGTDAVAPSAIKSPIHNHVPRSLSEENILTLINQFATAASIARECGFDAIEIMGSEGYLINQFVSPVTNKRKDNWGGSFEKRVNFPLNIIKAIRSRVGKDYPIIFRLSGDDLIPNSTTHEEMLQFAKLIENAGVDAFNIGIGWHESQVPTISSVVPRAGFIHIAKSIKAHVQLPVIGSNRINDPKLAEKLLKEGACDIVSMARPFLADPDLLQKADKGDFSRINTCVACNQACLDHIFEGKSVSCLVNPMAGREHKWKLQVTRSPNKIAVIGGGVAGMEAARALSEAGHHVTLYEATDQLGGQLNLAKQIPGKIEFAETIRYYTSELQRLGVEILFNHSPHSEDIINKDFEKVIVSVGVTPRIPNIPNLEEHKEVHPYNDILSGRIKPKGKIAIIGAGGIGCDLAHYLIEQDIDKITLMRRHGKIGEGIGKTTKWALLQHLKQHNVRFLTGLSYEKVLSNGLEILRNTDNGLIKEFIEADMILLAAGQQSVSWNESILLDAGIQVVKIGGARRAGELDAKRAIYEGARLAFSS